MTRFFLVSLVALTVMLAGCTTRVESNPARTATEQMLISTAADRAAGKLFVDLRAGTRVFLDTRYFEGTDSKYAVGTIRTALLKKGASLVDDKKKADVVVEARAGALSTDQSGMLIGIPAFSVPIPLASGSLPFPEVALYKNTTQQGVAKFAVTTFTAADGNLLAAQEPQYGFSHNDQNTVLFFISWKESDALPDEDKSALARNLDTLSGDAASPGTP